MKLINYTILLSAILISGFANCSFSQCSNVWNNQLSGSTANIRSVKAVNNLVSWASGNTGNIRRTTDGGVTWLNANPGSVTGSIISIEAIDASTAWCSAAINVYRTTDGGATWSIVFNQPGGYINGIRFSDASTGFMQGDPVGGRWSLWKTTNGGVSWDSAGLYLPRAGTEAGWNNSLFMQGNNIWFGTNNSRVYSSTNAGASWTYGATTGLLSSYGLYFNTPSLGLAGGTTITKTTDGGATFTDIGPVPGIGTIYGIVGNGSDFWYVRGTEIYRSTNSGGNWLLEHTAAGSLNHISFGMYNGCPVGWAGGNNTNITRMHSDTLTSSGNNNTGIPQAYSLEQNYPNPFNPVTTIKFSIPANENPHSSNVKLLIYDIRGMEVGTLVDGQLSPGKYTVDFDASHLSSGAYFYRLSTDGFTEVKKMLLIK